MSIRILMSALVAIAMSFAPLVMPMGAAMAAQSTHHGAMTGMAKDKHCSGEQKQDHSDKNKKSCCVAGCFALANLNVPEAAHVGRRRVAERPAMDQFRFGLPAEIATPPPRAS